MGESALPGLGAFVSRTRRAQVDLPTLLRCIVPGWSQYHRGDRRRGLLFFLGYFGLLLPGAVLAGTGLGSLFLGLAIALHTASITDAMVRAFATPRDRIALTLGCGLVLCAVLYAPMAWIISRIAIPIRIYASIPPFQQGEVLWYSRSATPVWGSLVLYTLPGVTVTGRTAAGNAANYRFQGDWIGRVVALPGQTVSVDNGRCLVDGVEVTMQPMAGPPLGTGGSLVVPDGHAFVLPEGLVPSGAQVNTNGLQQVFLVPTAQIFGRLYFRSWPLSRMSRLY
jgi:hypothetical protein